MNRETGADRPRAAAVDVRVLGPVELVGSGGTVVVLGKPRERTLLGLLALRRTKVVSQEALVDALWDRDPPRSALKTLHVHVSRLRGSLAVAGFGGLVATRPPGYQLVAEPEAVDAGRFDLLVAAGRTGPGETAARLRSALALWRGDVLAGNPVGGWALAEATRLHESRLYATEELFAAELATGRHAVVVAELEAFVAQHPLRERPWELLMLALYAGGRQGDALGAYRRARTVLMAELGVEPGPALRRVEASVLAGDEPPADWLGADPVRLVDPRDEPARPPRTGGSLAWAGVPAPVTTLVGRTKDLAELAGLLGERRLITLTGVGGCGKTRLAIAAATEHPGDVAFVDLTEVTDPDLVPAAVADALGARGEPTVDALAHRLRAAPALLVLDNCERLLDACARMVAALLRRCPGLRVLTTSREALGVPGETVWPVQPLSVPAGPVGTLAGLVGYDAVRLFLDRAALPAVRGLRDKDAPALTAICTGLDGLPLALELAAARTSVLTVGDIARRLRDPALLTGSRTHRALDAAVAWSYQALDQDARSRFRRLAVFTGGFTLAAAAAVWRDSAQRTIDALGDLVARSLVIVDHGAAETRYRMLEMIRHYAADRLAAEPAEQELAGRLHARHHLAVAVGGDARLRGPEAAGQVDLLAADHENLRSALAWFGGRGDADELRLAVALARYCRLRGRYREGRRWLSDALDRHPDPPPADPRHADWTAAQLAVAFLAHFEGSYAHAESHAGRALAAHRDRGDGTGTARCLRLLGSIAGERGEYDRSRAAYAEAMTAYQGLDDQLGQADVLQMTGFVAWLAGDLDGAEPLLEQALHRYAALSDAENLSSTRVHLAAVALYRGDLVRARWLAERALAHFTELDFKEGIAWALEVTGLVALRSGQPVTAVSALFEALRVHWEVGDRWRQSSVLDALAAAHLAADEPVRAAHLTGLATAVRERLGVPVPLIERDRWARTHAAIADHLPDEPRYAALTHGSTTTVPDVLALLALSCEPRG